MKQYIQEFHESNAFELTFIDKYSEQIKEITQTELEEILDFLYSNKEKDFTQIWFKTILDKKNKWHKTLSKKSTTTEIEGIDFETTLDFKNGFKFVQLISQNAYDTEWRKMSHCVSSYYWNDSTIYSLRDKNNNPHCTIEDWNQIKWKGNGLISPKYINYVVQFLEEKWMEMRDYEFENLGYKNIENLKHLLKDNLILFREKFLYDFESNIKDDVLIIEDVNYFLKN